MTIPRNALLGGGALAVALAFACTEGPDPVAPEFGTTGSATHATSYSGRATVVQATVLGLSTKLGDTGPLPSSGGAEEASLLDASVPDLLTAKVVHATTVGQGNASRSEASVANLMLTVAGNTISAGFLEARATAQCTDGGATASGSSEIATLTVNNQTITVSGEPNQTISLLGGAVLIINEQTSERPGDITVNALHVRVDDITDVVISSAHADITCEAGPPPAGCSGGDFVTGGGWITPSGAKANFGVAGGIKQGAFWGHLVYNDHGPNGPQVKGTSVSDYEVVSGTTTRHIEGTAEINGQGGFTYKVDATDNGEPGRNDVFALSLSNGYSAKGSLDGGNIQLHTPACQ